VEPGRGRWRGAARAARGEGVGGGQWQWRWRGEQEGVRARWWRRLQPRVHLHEVEAGRVCGVGDELDRACPLVVDRTRRPHRRLAQLLAEGGVDAGGGRLFEHLLVTPLHRAVTLEERHGAAHLVAEDLHLDVPRPWQVPLHE
jgi:hypothetical protein